MRDITPTLLRNPPRRGKLKFGECKTDIQVYVTLTEKQQAAVISEAARRRMYPQEWIRALIINALDPKE